MADHRLKIFTTRVIQEYRRIFGVPASEAGSDFNVATQTVIPEQRVRDLLTSAIEGGTGYWALIWEYQFASGLQYSDFQEDGKMQIPDNYHHPAELIPFVPGCAVLFVDSNEVARNADELPEGVTAWKLDRQALHDGLRVMAEHHLRHWYNFIEGNDDAETGDIFLQLCLFGEIVYA